MRLFRFLRIAVSLMALVACGGPEPFQSPVAPTIVSPVLTPRPPVTPPPDRGVVTGTLIDRRTSQPSYVTTLYLELSFNHGVPPVLYGPLNEQPTTTSAPGSGHFTFESVPPGEYILVLYSPIDILYAQHADGAALLVQVQAGQVTDLGQVVTYVP